MEPIFFYPGTAHRYPRSVGAHGAVKFHDVIVEFGDDIIYM